MNLTLEIFPFVLRFGEEKAYEMIKEAGFDGVDFSYNALGNGTAIDLTNYIEGAKKSKELLNRFGLVCKTAHAPFKMSVEDDFNMNNENFSNVVKSFEHASIMGIERIVVHSIYCPQGYNFIEKNIAYYKALEPYAKKANVKIAVENLVKSPLWTPEKLAQFISCLESDVFCACIDVGHSQIVGIPAEDFIQAMPKNLIQVIHLHDTDGRTDGHWIPYQGCHNWENIIKSLANYDYNGEMNLEVIHSYDNLPNDLILSALKNTANIGRHLIKLFKNYKKEV